MKPIRMIALGLIVVFIARQFQQSRQGTQRSLANQPDHLLPAQASAPSGPRQGAVASRDTHLPDYTPDEPPPSQRQPDNTPASQQITGAQWTDNPPPVRQS